MEASTKTENGRGESRRDGAIAATDLIGRTMQLWTADGFAMAYYEGAVCLAVSKDGITVRYCERVDWDRKRDVPSPVFKVDHIRAAHVQKMRLHAA